jgi:multicomponent Na+:H+ antiporter subunit G
MTAVEITGVVALMLGALSVLLAAVGILRMPDVFTRLQASSKAATLGAFLVITGAAIIFGTVSIAIKGAFVVAFLAITAPIGAHAIVRAAYVAGVRMADSDTIDDLEGRYEPGTHRLDSE